MRTVRMYEGGQLLVESPAMRSGAASVRCTTIGALLGDEVGESFDTAGGQEEGHPPQAGMPQCDAHGPARSNPEVRGGIFHLEDWRARVDGLGYAARHLGRHLAARLRKLKNQLLQFSRGHGCGDLDRD